MFPLTPQMKQLGAAKATGFAIGLAFFLVLPLAIDQDITLLRWGVLLWYTTLGGIIGLGASLERIPVLGLPLPAVLRGAVFGAWMNFVAMLFAWQLLTELFAALPLPAAIASPWLIVVEGALVGAVIGWAAQRIGGNRRDG